eukprot:scaffold167184_cov20-Prasinocladus_malaysianus.AAC.1
MIYQLDASQSHQSLTNGHEKEQEAVQKPSPAWPLALRLQVHARHAVIDLSDYGFRPGLQLGLDGIGLVVHATHLHRKEVAAAKVA